MFFLEEWFLWLFFFTGIAIILAFHIWKRKHFSSEQRRKATNLLLETNSTGKIGFIVLIILFIANFILDEIYGYEKLSRAVLYIPIWFFLTITFFRNRRTLTEAKFPQEHINFDFNFGLLMMSWWGAFLLLLFLFY